ncbi:hypothetical protein AVEN_43503-1 [Araneus ventricosus]|uniref:Uncharacterized protein n=1 Tax=Araneus ventricosus TaxID=182803 RepID=A0A4Y2F5G9_ARAVE|nr:hypothetical protein AVEN_43503-1 [Araneus ventricosus]
MNKDMKLKKVENQENSDINIDDSDGDPDYVATDDGSDTNTFDYDYLLEVPLLFFLRSPPVSVSTHAESSNNGLPVSTFSSEARASNCNSRDYHAFEDFVKKSEGDNEDDHVTVYQIVNLKIVQVIRAMNKTVCFSFPILTL